MVKTSLVNSKFTYKLIFVSIPLTVFVIVMSLIVQNREEILEFPWELHWGNIILSLFFHSLALWVTFGVWHLMIKELSGFNQIRTNIRFYYVSTLAKRIPTFLPYVGGRLFLYKKVNVSNAVVLSSVFLENTLIGWAGILVFAAFLPFYTIDISTTFLNGLFAISCITIGFLLFLRTNWGVMISGHIQNRLKQSGLDRYPSHRNLVLWSSGYAPAWIFAGLSFYYAIHGLSEGITITMQDALAISTLATLVAILNLVFPTGLGLKELTIAALLTPWMSISSAIIMSLLYRLLHTFNELCWAGLALLLKESGGENDQV